MCSSRTAVLFKLTNQTLAVDERELGGCDVHITNCRRSTIYLLSPMRWVWFDLAPPTNPAPYRTVTLEKCSHCLLILGAVESVVAVSNCDSITLVAACRKIHIR